MCWVILGPSSPADSADGAFLLWDAGVYLLIWVKRLLCPSVRRRSALNTPCSALGGKYSSYKCAHVFVPVLFALWDLNIRSSLHHVVWQKWAEWREQEERGKLRRERWEHHVKTKWGLSRPWGSLRRMCTAQRWRGGWRRWSLNTWEEKKRKDEAKRWLRGWRNSGLLRWPHAAGLYRLLVTWPRQASQSRSFRVLSRVPAQCLPEDWNLTFHILWTLKRWTMKPSSKTQTLRMFLYERSQSGHEPLRRRSGSSPGCFTRRLLEPQTRVLSLRHDSGDQITEITTQLSEPQRGGKFASSQGGAVEALVWQATKGMGARKCSSEMLVVFPLTAARCRS